MRQNCKIETAQPRALSDSELATVSGANIMDIIVKAAFPALTKECLYRLTREGTIVYCPKGLG